MLCIQTQNKQAKEFVERTRCDSLAIAIGTSHGAYKFKGEPKLRFDILAKNKRINTKYSNCITWCIYSYTRTCRYV